ncbi:glycerophosphodiester phosphodiesterase [Agromyces intestinalis]|uniref:Glycerophosphodiester phosphodiesterase n=1 Tax=Agromyces intestinalis TaxID=2592652 RepID=A0A5C1Y9X5_9MICO|nr:glycerophosphodiester phosphodiesterase [Agromyces intestinalis]QEO12993.1 glycerophosphodiester phosphodiesterase [Agromyces intestinalis]
MGYFSPEGPRVLAHRGLAVDAPENTLTAFEAAVRSGAAYVETDVHRSRDGVAVVSHDPTLDRVAGHRVRVGDLTAAELAAIDLGRGAGLPTLADALAAFPDTRFNIDVKEAAAVDATVDAVRSTGSIDRILLTSFDDARRRRLAGMLPGVATSVGSAGVVRALLTGRFGATAMRRAVRGAAALQVPERAGRVRIVSPGFVRAAHAAGLEVHVWTVNEPDDMRRLLAYGVDGLVTDRCDLALEIVARN